MSFWRWRRRPRDVVTTPIVPSPPVAPAKPIASSAPAPRPARQRRRTSHSGLALPTRPADRRKQGRRRQGAGLSGTAPAATPASVCAGPEPGLAASGQPDHVGAESRRADAECADGGRDVGVGAGAGADAGQGYGTGSRPRRASGTEDAGRPRQRRAGPLRQPIGGRSEVTTRRFGEPSADVNDRYSPVGVTGVANGTGRAVARRDAPRDSSTRSGAAERAPKSPAPMHLRRLIAGVVPPSSLAPSAPTGTGAERRRHPDRGRPARASTGS